MVLFVGDIAKHTCALTVRVWNKFLVLDQYWPREKNPKNCAQFIDLVHRGTSIIQGTRINHV
jgi:hypothetical protein